LLQQPAGFAGVAGDLGPGKQRTFDRRNVGGDTAVGQRKPLKEFLEMLRLASLSALYLLSIGALFMAYSVH
jgi:hypothetical protein